MESKVHLGNLVNIKTGKLDANAAVENGKYPFFTTAKEISRIDTYSYDDEVVLVAGNGDLNVKYYSGKFDAYQRTYILTKQKNREVSLKYIYYFLESYLDTLRYQSIGGVIKYIKLANLTDAKLLLPPLPTQHYIATIFDHATALIEKRKAQIAELDKLVNAVFLEMFGDPTVNSKDWEIEKLVNVCNPKQWRTISTSELLPSGYTVYGANGIIGYFNEYTHQNPTLMITCRGATCGNVHISKPFSYINGNAMALDDLNNSKVNILFLFYLLKIRNFYDVISGSAQPQITKQGLDVVLIPLPPLGLQTLFAEKVCRIQAEKDRLQRSLVEMEQYLQSLMAKFFG